MTTKFVIDPKDPERSYVETEDLLEIGFIKAPIGWVPGQKLPNSFFMGPEGHNVVDQTTMAVAERLRTFLSEEPTEEEISKLLNSIKTDLDNPVESQKQTIHENKNTFADGSDAPPKGEPLKAGISPPEQTITTPENPGTADPKFDDEGNFIYPNIEISETPESAVKRWFNKDISQVTKPEIGNMFLKKYKVPINQAKVKPMMINDGQKIEMTFR